MHELTQTFINTCRPSEKKQKCTKYVHKCINITRTLTPHFSYIESLSLGLGLEFSNLFVCHISCPLSVLTWLSNKTDGWTVTRAFPGEPWPPRVCVCLSVCDCGPSVWAVESLSLFALSFWPTSSTVNAESPQATGSVSLFVCVCQYIEG